MEDLKNLSPTELLKRVNDLNREHELMKTKILSQLEKIEEEQKILETYNNSLSTIEDEYVRVMGELTNR